MDSLARQIGATPAEVLMTSMTTEFFLSMQGSSVGCIYVGSGDPVRVLRLSHNEYAGYTLKHLLLRHMYNLPLPKLPATLLVAGTQLFSAVVTP